MRCGVNVLEFVHLVIVCEVVGERYGALVRLRNVHLHAVRCGTVSVSSKIIVTVMIHSCCKRNDIKSVKIVK
jgi:hypothetical protein